MVDHRREAEQLFHAVVELSPRERASMLDERCADDASLRAVVERLLEAHDSDTGDVLDTPVVRWPTRPGEQPGDRIGPFVLERRLGEGGMGVVHLAEQSEPVRRQVALKLVKLGMDTRQVIARFEAERRLVARLEHPHIARVYEAGATDDGRPYFVMEYVQGTAITAYCDTHRLGIPARIRLFALVCDAVQHAHQQGVIHRDLKPSNVLVAERDGEPIPKIIDFGVGKALQSVDGDTVLQTAVGNVIGTAEYMSPEQACGDTVDTRTDVYALGVLLFELLTGSIAHPEARTLSPAALAERLRGATPPRPSARIADVSLRASARRRARPRRLARMLRGDLDWITQAAMAARPSRRYASASELAADLRAHLDYRPVTARPPSMLYALGRTVLRHRVPATLLVLLGVVMIVATVISVTAALIAIDARSESEDRRTLAESQRTLAGLRATLPLLQRGDIRGARAMLEAVPVEHRHWEWRYLHAQLDRSVQVLHHERGLRPQQLTYTPNGNLLMSWDDARAFRLDAQTGAYEELDGWAPIRRQSFSADGNRTLTCARDGRIIERDLTTMAVVQTYEGHGKASPGLGYVAGTDLIVSASLDKTIRLWNRTSGECVKVARDHDSSIIAFALSADGSRLATGAEDRTVRLWDPRTLECIAVLDQGRLKPPNTRPVRWGRTTIVRLQFTPDGTRLATAARDGSVKLFDATDGREIALVGAFRSIVRWVEISGDGRWLAACTARGGVAVWDLDTLEVVATHDTGFEARRVRFSPDSTLLVVGSLDGSISVFDVKTHELILSRWAHGGHIRNMEFAPDGRRMATAAEDGTVRLWDMTSVGLDTLPVGGHSYRALYAPDASWLAVGVVRPPTEDLWPDEVEPHRVEIWNVITGERLAMLPSPGGVVDLAYSEADGLLAATSNDGTVGLWSTSDWREVGRLRGHARRVGTCDFHPEGGLIATGSADGSVRLWDPKTANETARFDQHESEVNAVRFTADGSRLVSCDWRGVVNVRRLGDGQAPATPFQVPGGNVDDMAFDPTSNRVAVNRGQDVLVLRLDDTQLSVERVIEAHSDRARGVTFHPSGNRLVSSGNDGTIRIFDVETGSMLTRLSGFNHLGNVHRVVFSPDGHTLVSTGGRIRLWHAPPE